MNNDNNNFEQSFFLQFPGFKFLQKHETDTKILASLGVLKNC